MAAGARVTATDARAPGERFGPQHLLDGRDDTYWATGDATLRAEAVFDFAAPVTFGVVRLREAITFGQRIDRVAIDGWNGADWQLLAAVTGIGPRRLIRLDRPVTAARLRLRVTEASASPVLSEFALFAEAV